MTVMTCSAVLLGATVSAQSGTGPDEVPSVGHVPTFQKLRIPALLWVSGVAADQLTTYEFSSRYPGLLHETNPFIRGLDGHPVLLVTAGTAIDAATGWAAYRFLGRRHPLLLKMAFYGAAAYRSYLAVYNVEMMRRAQAIRAASLSAAIP